MDVTAKYELIGLMAYPIRHSLSPEMQNKALEKAGLPFTYMAFEVDNDSFPGAIEGLKALKMRGTGVSMPNKQLACEYVDELTPAAKLVGAINTIVNDDGYLRGYNTDGTGHIRAIKESGFDIKGKTMVLLGAGGASTAIGAQGAIEGLKEIILDNLKEFGNVPQNLIEFIGKQDNMDILKYWNKIAVMAESLDEFEEKIK